MATRTISVFECDIQNDGTEATTQRTFSVQGRDFQIDLCDKDGDKFDAAMAPWITAARQTGGRHKAPTSLTESGPASTPSASRGSRKNSESAAIREWAAKKGVEVSARGVIAQSVRDAYHKDVNKTA
jgi:hypothetical protein